VVSFGLGKGRYSRQGQEHPDMTKGERPREKEAMGKEHQKEDAGRLIAISVAKPSMGAYSN